MWNGRYNHYLAVENYIDIKCLEATFENCMSPSAGRRRHTHNGGMPSLLFSKPDGEDAEEADDDAENRHETVAFAEADGGI